MAMAATSQAAKRLGIVVGGGPAPGINGTIGAVAIEAGNRGHDVIGIYDGFSHLSVTSPLEAGTTKWGFQRGLNIPFGRERGSYPDREILG